MAYKALYRKYRPDSFDSVVGQTAIVKTLQNIVEKDKISHAYLFSGPRGTGKTSIAKIFAKAINCLEPHEGMPCGECSICKQIAEDQISDIIEIDAASNNGVDEIRDLKSKINLVPTVCKYKVYIIDEVHMLSIGAFNALLKTLEEPPHHVVFILATTEMHKLPLTIISRCQNFNFRKITEEQMKSRLQYIADQENMDIEEAALYEIAKVSDGGMRDAIGLLEQLFSFTTNHITTKDVELLSSSVSRKDIASIVEKIIDNDIESIFKEVDQFYQDGKDFIKISEDIVVFLKDILLYKKAKSYFRQRTAYDMEIYAQVVSKLSENYIYNFITEFNKAIGDLKVSSHPKIIFEITLLKLVDGGSLLENDNSTANIETEKPVSIQSSSVLISKVEETNQSRTEIQVKEEISNVITEAKEEQTTSVTMVKAETVVDDVTYNGVTLDEVDDLELYSNLPDVKIDLYKKIIVNNTLGMADKALLMELKDKCNQLQTFLINKDFKQAASTLLDGKIVGASSQNIIYAYAYDVMVEKADEIIEEIERLISNIAGNKFKVVNITEEAWSELRPYYVKLMKEKKKIDILPEVDASKIRNKARTKKKSKEIEAAINMFGEDLIEIK